MGEARFGCSVIVSWGGLTSSKLQAPSYEEIAVLLPSGFLSFKMEAKEEENRLPSILKKRVN